MRANFPTAGNPWPRDMGIHIDPHSHLLTLLYVRHAWGLARAFNIPEIEPAPEVGESAMPPTASQDEWTLRWEELWRRAWACFNSDDPVPPRWESEYARDGIDRVALNDWLKAVRGPLPTGPASDSPEWRCLDALVPAWRAGIESIIVLPYRGYYLHRLSHRHLAVSKATRDDPELYRRALATIR